MNLFLIHEEKAGCLAETRDLSGELEVVDVCQCIVKPRFLISTVLEVPKVVVCVSWSFPLVMVRYCMQGSTVLTAISRNNTDHMGIRSHDDPSIACRDAPPFIVSNDAGDKVDSSIEIEP